jgi:hypothetical protein
VRPRSELLPTRARAELLTCRARSDTFFSPRTSEPDSPSASKLRRKSVDSHDYEMDTDTVVGVKRSSSDTHLPDHVYTRKVADKLASDSSDAVITLDVASIEEVLIPDYIDLQGRLREIEDVRVHV